MRIPSLTLMTLAALLGHPLPAALAAPPAGWDTWIPEATTAVLLIDATALNNSPLAAREGWAKRHTAGSPADVTSLPDGIASALIATDFSPRTLADTWRVGLIDLKRPATAAAIAAREGGRTDTVRGLDVVVTPRDLVLVSVAPTRVATRQPADRQALGRWLETSKAGRAAGPSSYLRTAVELGVAPVVIAIDLTDAIDAAAIGSRLKASTTLAGRGPADIDALARLLSGLKGVTLAVRVKETIDAEMRFDFSGPADLIKPVLLPLVREALQGAGMDLEDLSAWSARVDGTTGYLSGRLTENSFRLAVSPFYSSTSVGAGHSESSPAAGGDPKATAALNYFRALTELVDHVRTLKGLNLEPRLRWYYETATKIEALPMLGVDADLLTFGASISTTLRSMANTIAAYHNRGVVIEQNAFAGQASLGYNNTVYAGGYNRYGRAVGVGYSAPATAYVNNYSQINNMVAANSANEGAFRTGTWANIDSAMLAMRRKMTERYQIEFPAMGAIDGTKK